MVHTLTSRGYEDLYHPSPGTGIYPRIAEKKCTGKLKISFNDQYRTAGGEEREDYFLPHVNRRLTRKFQTNPIRIPIRSARSIFIPMKFVSRTATP